MRIEIILVSFIYASHREYRNVRNKRDGSPRVTLPLKIYYVHGGGVTWEAVFSLLLGRRSALDSLLSG